MVGSQSQKRWLCRNGDAALAALVNHIHDSQLLQGCAVGQAASPDAVDQWQCSQVRMQLPSLQQSNPHVALQDKQQLMNVRGSNSWTVMGWG